MATYIGFNTTNVCKEEQSLNTTVNGGIETNALRKRTSKKFKLTDAQLVVQDFLNSLNIKKGDKVGNPAYGTLLWSYLFEPNLPTLRNNIETEIRRMAALDPRISINSLSVFNERNGILVEMSLEINPFDDTVQVGILLNTDTSTVSQVS